MSLVDLVLLGIGAMLAWTAYQLIFGWRDETPDPSDELETDPPPVPRPRLRSRPRRTKRHQQSELEPADVLRDWRDLLDRGDVVILDTETTGLGSKAELIEVGCLDMTGDLRFQALSMPQGRIPMRARDIHGLTRAFLRREGARPWPEVHPELVEARAGAHLVMGWNVGFDRRLLEQTSQRHGLAMPKLACRDLLRDYRTLRRDVPGRHTLDAACEREGIGAGPAHRAESDCRRVLAVMRAVVEGE